MKIGLIDIDSKIPNLALAKIEMYHRQRGDEIFFDLPLLAYQMDKLYVSCVFTWNRHQAKNYEQYQAIIGGSGYSLTTKLPVDIDGLRPKINYGFSTRGCVRNCPFCIVPQKEGKIKGVGDLYDIWDGQSKWVVFLDNNILALPKHFKQICLQVKKENLKVDFNQGLDIRLFTEEQAAILKNLRPIKQWRFAFDSKKYEKAFRVGAECIKAAGIIDSKICVYVLAGYGDTIEDVLYRINVIYNEYGFDPFVMLYRSFDSGDGTHADYSKIKNLVNVPTWEKHKTLRTLARWVNRKALFKKVSWENYLFTVTESEDAGLGWKT